VVKKIVFLGGPCGREVWMWNLYLELKKTEEIEPHFIALRQKDVDFFNGKGVFDDKITKIFSLKSQFEPDEDYLRECERKYEINIWDFWNITLARDKKRQKLDRKEVLSYFQSSFKQVEKIIDEFKPDIYLYYGVAGYDTALFNEVFRQKEVRVLEYVAAIMPNRFTFSEDLSNHWRSLIHEYEEIKKDGLIENERREAEKFIEGFRNKPKVPDCARVYREGFGNKLNRYKNYAKQVLKYRELPSNMRFVVWPVIQKYYDVFGYFEKYDESKGEKIVLFPLHFQPEATTLIYGKWYVDQVNLIGNIVKALPLGYTLYVKEHPFGYGNRNPDFYKRIKALPNVRLISPRENNFGLIHKCSLLVTITGTSGWEALLLGKKVVTFGNIFFNICSETERIENIENLPAIVRNSLDKRIDDEELIIFVAALQKCSYPGLARLPSDCRDSCLEEDNMQLLAKGFFDYLEKYPGF